MRDGRHLPNLKGRDVRRALAYGLRLNLDVVVKRCCCLDGGI